MKLVPIPADLAEAIANAPIGGTLLPDLQSKLRQALADAPSEDARDLEIADLRRKPNASRSDAGDLFDAAKEELSGARRRIAELEAAVANGSRFREALVKVSRAWGKYRRGVFAHNSIMPAIADARALLSGGVDITGEG